MFQERLYQLRKARGISQEELADVVGVSRQAVQKWESGASRPDMDNLVAISRYFGVSMDELVTGAEPPSAAPVSTTWPGWHYEYQSGARLFGLPLIHINLGHGRMYRAKGVLAIGNAAVGVLALGGVSVGLVSLGALSVGGLAVGGLAAGALCAAGGLALSFGLAVGGCALSTSYALGGAAVAGKVAAGGVAMAPIAIGEAASGILTFPKAEWGPGTADAVLAAVTHTYPHTPLWLAQLFAAVAG